MCISRWMVFIFVIWALGLGAAHAQDEHVFVTWKGIEPDKCASAWLLARFVDPKATFRMIPREAKPPKQGILFDTPSAAFKTSHRQSTFASICEQYALNDPGVLRIRRIIQDIELNKWEKSLTKEAPGLSALINGLRKQEGEGQAALISSFVLFDWLYASFSNAETF